MVKDYVNHAEHLPVMERFGQPFQVVCRPKPDIELGDISDPVSMIWFIVWCPRGIVVVVDWAETNGGEANDWM